MTLLTAWKGAGAGANSSLGNTPWLNPGRITANDGSLAGGTITTATDDLLATSFGFTTSDVPVNGIVLGVNVRVTGANTASDAKAEVHLRSSAGLSSGSVLLPEWPAGSPTDQYVYGQSIALWGIAPDIYSSSWGCTFRCNATGTWGVGIDYIEMQLEYILASGNQVIFIS